MEWPKIKNILIVALLFTNLLLIGLIAFSHFNFTNDEKTDLIPATIKILEENGVTVLMDIPEINKNLPVLFLNYDKIKGRFLYSPEKSEAASPLSDTTAISTSEKFLTDSGIKNSGSKDTVVLEEAVPSKDIEDIYIISYGNYYKDFKIEGIYTKCYVSANGVTKMERNWAWIDSAGKVAREIIPATTALLKYMTQIKEASPDASAEITGIDLVYMVGSSYSKQVTSDTAFPTWKITDANDNITYISAYK